MVKMRHRRKKTRVICVVGARPNFVKIAPLLGEFKKYSAFFDVQLVHTGQHYNKNLSKIFFDEFGIRKIDWNLNIGSGTHAGQTAAALVGLERVFLREKPDLVIVVGDVNSTLAGALAAVKLNIPVAHIEAGLRSFNNEMPEEINRKVTDHISSYLFTSCEDAGRNLQREGVPKNSIFFVGNVMIDTLIASRRRIDDSRILDKLGVRRKGYIVLTLHRPENVNEIKRIAELLRIAADISGDIRVIFPIHPRTKKQLEVFKIERTGPKLDIIDPLGYFDFQKLIKHARLVITDSGGVQEETTFLNIPCLTLLNQTERPITVKRGTNYLVARNRKSILEKSSLVLAGSFKKRKSLKFWDGKAASRIVRILLGKYRDA